MTSPKRMKKLAREWAKDLHAPLEWGNKKGQVFHKNEITCDQCGDNFSHRGTRGQVLCPACRKKEA